MSLKKLGKDECATRTSCKKMLRRRGLKVGPDATNRFKEIIESYASELSDKISSLVKYKNKTIINKGDINYALQELGL